MSIRNILWTITDSIGMGYGDVPFNDRPRGLLFRLKQDLNEFTAQDPTWSICNFGYAGATARQYYNRVKAIFLATPIDQRPTAVLFSIYSPNGIFPNGTFTPVRVTGPDSAYAIAQEAETFFQGYNVKFIPWFICLSLYGIGSAESIWVRDNVYYPAQTLWGPKLLQSIDVVQDPAVDLATTGIQMLASLTLDATHPNATGYNLIQSGGSLGAGASLKNRFIACTVAAGVTAPFYRNSAILSPGGLNTTSTAAGPVSYLLPLHLYNDVEISSIEIGGWNTQGVAWDIRRAYIGKRNCPGVLTEDLNTGFKTLVGSVTSINALGSPTDPKVKWVGEIPTAGLVGDFVVYIEIGTDAELRSWGADDSASVGFGNGDLDVTNWTQLKLSSLPATGPFDPYAFSGFSAGTMPNVLFRCKGLSRNIMQPYNFGDSIAQGYGSEDSFKGKSGLMLPWARRWETADLPYIPLQMGWQGYSSIMIRQLIKAIRRELGDNPTFLQAATINNWSLTYSLPDPSGQNIADLEANLTDFGQVPVKLWLGFGSNSQDASVRASMRSCHDTIEGTYTSGMYGNETCNVMDPVTMLYLTDMGYSDLAHPSALGWSAFEASNYDEATAFLATVLT